MARIRTIKPDFWVSETIASVSRDARLLFICCLNLADDEGLLRWSASYLKASAFMYDDDIFTESVSELMDELVTAELIFPYKGGKVNATYGWIVSFREHQKINRPQPSKLPPPNIQNPQIRAVYARRDGMICQISGERIEALSERHRGDKASLSLDHIIPVSKGGTDYPSNIRATRQSANKSRGNRADCDDEEESSEQHNEQFSEQFSERVTAGKERKGRGKEVKEMSVSDKTDPPEPEEIPEGKKQKPNRISYPEHFENFWKTINQPNGWSEATGNKKQAFEAWKKLKLETDHELRAEIREGYKRQIKALNEAAKIKPDQQAWPHACRWLRDEGWTNPSVPLPKAGLRVVTPPPPKEIPDNGIEWEYPTPGEQA